MYFRCTWTTTVLVIFNSFDQMRHHKKCDKYWPRGFGGEFLIALGFNDMPTLVVHFVLSPTEREKRDRRDSRRDEREGQGRKRNRNEGEETEEITRGP